MSCDVVSRTDRLKEKLAQVLEAGYQAVELPIQGMRIIENGVIDPGRLEAYAELLREFPLRYTLHAPFDLNVFRPDDIGFEQRLLLACLDVAGAVGADLLVVHVGRFVGEEQFLYPQTWPRYTDADKRLLLEREAAIMREAGEYARQRSVRIGMENVRPYLDCPDYCYSVIPAQLAEQVAAIGHPNVGIALDVGHLYLSLHMYGLSLQRELEAMVPYIIHLHVHDNYGKPNYSTEKNQYELLPLGRGDMHMPIGEGAVPMAEIAQLLGGCAQEGYMIHEIREQYESHWTYLSATYRDLSSFGKAVAVG